MVILFSRTGASLISRGTYDISDSVSPFEFKVLLPFKSVTQMLRCLFYKYNIVLLIFSSKSVTRMTSPLSFSSSSSFFLFFNLTFKDPSSCLILIWLVSPVHLSIGNHKYLNHLCRRHHQSSIS